MITSIYQQLETISDPEIPVLSIVDLGIIRKVEEYPHTIEVTITPTYSGCPAMDLISDQIKALLHQQFQKEVTILQALSPAWTTDWISESGKQKLAIYGIAPPLEESADKLALMGKSKQVTCPNCHSTNTQMQSLFGSTACKALFKCLDCLEPFDYFKCLK